MWQLANDSELRKLWLIPLGAGGKYVGKLFFFLNNFIKIKTLNGNMSLPASFKTGMCQNKCFYFDLSEMLIIFTLYCSKEKPHLLYFYLCLCFLDNYQKPGTAGFQSEFLAFLFRDFQFLVHGESRCGCTARTTHRWELQYFRFLPLAVSCFFSCSLIVRNLGRGHLSLL